MVEEVKVEEAEPEPDYFKDASKKDILEFFDWLGKKKLRKPKKKPKDKEMSCIGCGRQRPDGTCRLFSSECASSLNKSWYITVEGWEEERKLADLPPPKEREKVKVPLVDTRGG